MIEHESTLLEKLDKLAGKYIELVTNISNAMELVGSGLIDQTLGMGNTMETLDISCSRLKSLLQMDGPDLSEATAIAMRGEMLRFKKKRVDLDVGEMEVLDGVQLRRVETKSRCETIQKKQ